MKALKILEDKKIVRRCKTVGQPTFDISSMFTSAIFEDRVPLYKPRVGDDDD